MTTAGSAKSVFLVTVTYGRRCNLLVQVLESAFREGIDHAVVVDNGVLEPIQPKIAELFDGRVEIISLGRNTGSANGFKEGLQAAYNAGAEHILLLDDDNVLEPGAIAVLKEGWSGLDHELPAYNRLTLGFRPEHQTEVAEGLSETRANQHPNCFLGFRILDIPFKLWRRTHWFRKRTVSRKLSSIVRLNVAPYSGMFFHRSLLEKYGYPNPEMILYGDDTEFSFRFTNAGGHIWLLTEARIKDLESSWHVRARYPSSFSAWLNAEGDSRIYYSARNHVYFETHCRPHNPFMYMINRHIYMGILSLLAYKGKKRNRYRLIQEAVQDGIYKRLGLNDRFPL